MSRETCISCHRFKYCQWECTVNDFGKPKGRVYLCGKCALKEKRKYKSPLLVNYGWVVNKDLPNEIVEDE